MKYLETKAGPNFNSWYDQMSNIIKENGPDVCEQMDCVMGYNITNLKGTDDKVQMIIDMRNDTEHKGAVLL